MNSQQIQEKIHTATTNPDTDMQYMAARDLSEELQNFYKSNQQNGNQKIINDIYLVLHTHLNSEYRDIQGNAIKCIQSLAPFMRAPEVEFILSKLLNSSITGKADNRENFHICTQEIVEKVSIQVEVIPNLLPIIAQTLKEKKNQAKQLEKSNQIVHQEIQQCVQVQSELLKIATSIMHRWPQLSKIDFSDLLLDNIHNVQEMSIRKNSSVCLGTLGLCLKSDVLNNLIKTKLLPHLQKMSYDNVGFYRCLYLNQTMNYLAKSSGHKFYNEIVESIYNIFKRSLELDGDVDYDLTSQYAEILEVQMLCWIHLTKHQASRQFDEEVIKNILKFIDYDPLGVAIDLNEQQEDEEYYFEETQDSTWRVRRGSILLLQELLKHQPNLYKLIMTMCFGEEDRIMKRLNEKNNEIRSAIILFLITLVQSSAIKSEQSTSMDIEELQLLKQRSIEKSISIDDLLIKLLSKVQAIFADQGEQQQLKSESAKLLLTLVQYFTHKIQYSDKCLQILSDIIQQSLSSTIQTNEQKIIVIIVTKLICKLDKMEQFHQIYFQKIFQYILVALQQKYIRIIVESLQVIEILLGTIHDSAEQFQGLLQSLKIEVIDRMKIDNLDQEIKLCLLKLSIKLLQNYVTLFSQDEINLLGQIACSRLQLEQLAPLTLQMIACLPPLQDAITLTANVSNLLFRQDKNKGLIFQALLSIMQRNQIQSQTKQHIVQAIKNITSDHYDLQIQTLLYLNADLPQEMIVEACLMGCVQQKLSNEVQKFFKSQTKYYQVIEQSLLSKHLNKEEQRMAGQIYASILSLDQLEQIYQTLNVNRQLKLSALRYLYINYQNQYNIQQAIQILSTLIQQQQDADLAAMALGAAINNQNQIIQLLNSNQTNVFYYIATKEFVEIRGSNQEMVSFIIQLAKGKDKIIISILGEILGLLLKQNSNNLTVQTQILNGAKNEDQGVRYACISSLRASTSWSSEAQFLLELLPKEEDISIKTAIIKALTLVVGKFKFVNFIQNLKESLRLFQERELNFGNFIEKRDDAKDLRSLSFDLLEMSLDKQRVDFGEVLNEVMNKIEEDKYDETRIPRFRILSKLSQLNLDLLKQAGSQIAKCFTPIMKNVNLQIAKKDQNIDKEIEKIRLIVNISSKLRDIIEINEFYQQQINQNVLDYLK